MLQKKKNKIKQKQTNKQKANPHHPPKKEKERNHKNRCHLDKEIPIEVSVDYINSSDNII